MQEIKLFLHTVEHFHCIFFQLNLAKEMISLQSSKNAIHYPNFSLPLQGAVVM